MVLIDDVATILDRQKIEDTKDIILKDTAHSLDTLRCQDDTQYPGKIQD